MSKFKLGNTSLKELQGVDLDLAAVPNRAIEITEQDFSVHDGMRTQAEQQALFQGGASTTMDSKHLIGKAVDVVPYINGKLRWEWIPIFKVAAAMRQAAKELGVPLRWGAAWDINFTETTDDPETVMEQYVARFNAKQALRPPEKRKKLFLDGPHFEKFYV